MRPVRHPRALVPRVYKSGPVRHPPLFSLSGDLEVPGSAASHCRSHWIPYCLGLALPGSLCLWILFLRDFAPPGTVPFRGPGILFPIIIWIPCYPGALPFCDSVVPIPSLCSVILGNQEFSSASLDLQQPVESDRFSTGRFFSADHSRYSPLLAMGCPSTLCVNSTVAARRV